MSHLKHIVRTARCFRRQNTIFPKGCNEEYMERTNRSWTCEYYSEVRKKHGHLYFYTYTSYKAQGSRLFWEWGGLIIFARQFSQIFADRQFALSAKFDTQSILRIGTDRHYRVSVRFDRKSRSSPIRLSPIIGESPLNFRQLTNVQGIHYRKSTKLSPMIWWESCRLLPILARVLWTFNNIGES
jgi:hypothetical protein